MTKAAAEGGVKDESKETREKVFTQKRLKLKVIYNELLPGASNVSDCRRTQY